MITCSSIGYNGRLANQMFQFASTVGIARKLGYDPKFPLENFTQGNPHDYNGGKLRECFDIPEEYFISRNDISGRILYEYNETSFKYNQETELLPDNVNLKGYFQSELYFKDSEGEIRNLFKFREGKTDPSLISHRSTCVHVRRGDYVSSPNHHPVQSREYYLRAMNQIGEGTFYVFSDDLQWCKDNIQFSDMDIVFIDIEDPYVSLNLMAQCSNHVIANSSLSWWAAWLGKKEGQKVFSPSNWFGPALSHNDTSDLYCKEWYKI